MIMSNVKRNLQNSFQLSFRANQKRKHNRRRLENVDEDRNLILLVQSALITTEK